MRGQKNSQELRLRAVDFFCSGGGMTTGFRKAGINVLGGIDIDPNCERTYVENNPGSKFIHEDIQKLECKTLKQELGIRKNEDDLIFIGCSPCQYWSKIITNKTKSRATMNLLSDFQKFVEYFRPGFVVIENVPGILNRFDESPLSPFLALLKQEGYTHAKAVINASHYGVPQTRRRFLLIASRVANVTMPVPDTKTNPPTVRQFIGDKEKFKPINAGHKDQTLFIHSSAAISLNNLERLSLTPKDGGTRMAWKDTPLQIPAYIGKDDSFQDIYGRMFWDRPAPTITTKFYSITNGRFAHPEQNRAVSLREGATLQTFDTDYNFFFDSQALAGRLIGNAVPPQLALRIAQSLLKSIHYE